MISWKRQNCFTLTNLTYKVFMKASLNMTKMASWLNCKRFQTKMNSKSQKFLERGSLLHVLLGLHNPTLRGKKIKLLSLTKRGLHQPYPTGFKWRRGSSALEVSSSPALWGEMCILMKTGLHQPDPTGCKWKRDFIIP